MRVVVISRANQVPQIYLEQIEAEMVEAGGSGMIKLGTNREKVGGP